jgi:hypothetical protein
MRAGKIITSVFVVFGLCVATAGSGIAQGMMGGSTSQGMMRGGMMQGDRGTMGESQTGHGMMGQGMMHGGGGGMMCPMMGSMMQSDNSGMGVLFGSRVVPTMNLSEGDVRGYLTARLDRLGNKRLKIGDVKVEGGSITADIVTADNSLVQRMKVDRSTGNIEYEN